MSANKPIEISTTVEEEGMFVNLRAKAWDDFIGQTEVKKSLRISIDATKKRNDSLEHVLLYGPPGLGKTTMAHIIGRELGSSIRVTSGPALERSGDIAAILTNLEKNDILFIDEIHRIHRVVEETLYTAMEDYCLDVVIGKGPAARTVRLDLPPFTIVGATTRIGLLSQPLRDRFGIVHRMEYYSPKELSQVISKAARKLNVSISDQGIATIAKRSRGTPRIALRILKRIRDVADITNNGKVNDTTLTEALLLLAIDEHGLDRVDRSYLHVLIDLFHGGPVGVETLAAAMSEDPDTIEAVIEPYLIQSGLITRTPRGRQATKHAYSHLDRNQPDS